MALGDDARDAAIDLLGEGLPAVASAQSGLDVADVGARIERCQRRRGNRCRVTLDQDPIGPFRGQNRLEPRQDRRGNLGWALIVLHHVQVVVGLNAEDAQNLVEHGPMLRRDADAAVDTVWVPRQFQDHRPQLDRLGARPKDGQDLQHRVTILTMWIGSVGERTLVAWRWLAQERLRSAPAARLLGSRLSSLTVVLVNQIYSRTMRQQAYSYWFTSGMTGRRRLR